MKTSPKKPSAKTAEAPKSKTTPTRGISTAFWIQPEDLTRLRKFAAEHDLSVSNVINRAIRRFLADPNPFFRP